MVPYWPNVAKDPSENETTNEFARMFTSLDKVVFSRTLESVDGNTRIVRGNLREEILSLKQQEGKDISLGGVDLPSQLIAMDLVDEYHIVVHPILGGKGRRLLEDTVLQSPNLKLVDTKVLPSGCVALHYLRQE